MKTLLACALFLSFCLVQSGIAQQKATPPPFPGWANRTAPVAGAGTAAGGAMDNKDFLGEWEGFITDGDGSNPGQRRGNITLSITADKVTTSGGGGGGEGTYKITGGSGKVRNIDANGTGGQYQGKHYEGILTVEGNTLKWCSGNPGRGRPKELKTNIGSGYFLMVLTRKQ